MDTSETNREACKSFIKQVTIDRAFVTEGLSHIQGSNPWFFDFKKVLLEAEFLHCVSMLFFSEIQKNYPHAQVGGLETASLPIIAGIIAKSHESQYPLNGFFIRKSRKKTGLLNMVEGTLSDGPIVLVDDIVNSGRSIVQQIKILESLGKYVSAVYCIVRFREESFYQELVDRGIVIHSVFTLADFKDTLGLELIRKVTEEKPRAQSRSIQWVFRSPDPHLELVLPKSAPRVYQDKLFFGSDSGNFFCLDASTGTVIWKHKILFGSKRKMIMSSPHAHNGLVYFGAYDGNFYALDSTTGKKRWVFLEADWIGSSPCISAKHSHIYIGLEFGVWKKKGGIVALDAETGEKKWQYYEMGDFTHSSPAVSDTYTTVVCGCNDNFVYAFDSLKGTMRWKFETGGAIKGSCAFDEANGKVFFGSFDRCVYALDIQTGKCLWKFETEESIYATPFFHDGKVYGASLDKNIYCLNADTGEKLWVFETKGRIFASPTLIKEQICIGSNDARMYFLNKDTGECVEEYQFTERITNTIAYNPASGMIYVPTYANEVYALKEKDTV